MYLGIILALIRIRQIIFSITLVLSHNHPIGKSSNNPDIIYTAPIKIVIEVNRRPKAFNLGIIIEDVINIP